MVQERSRARRARNKELKEKRSVREEEEVVVVNG